MREKFEAYLKEIKYKNWEFNVHMEGDHLYLQVGFWEHDNSLPPHERGEKTYQKGRKWILSRHMTKSEVIQTGFKAILTAEEHEIRENFTYKGKAIFGPHFCVDVLVDACKKEAQDIRMDPIEMERTA